MVLLVEIGDAKMEKKEKLDVLNDLEKRVNDLGRSL